MNIVRLTALSFVFAILSACSGQSAAKYNNMVLSMDSGLVPAIESAETKISRYAEAAQWDSVSAVSRRMESLVGEKVDQLTKQDPPDVKGADEFKKEVIRYFTFIKQIYSGYDKIATQSTDDARLKEYENFSNMVKRKKEVVQSFQAAVLRFTKANNIRAENK